MIWLFDGDDFFDVVWKVLAFFLFIFLLDKVVFWLGGYYQFFADILIDTGVGYKATIVAYFIFLIVAIIMILKLKKPLLHQLYLAPLQFILLSLSLRLGIQNREAILTYSSWKDLAVLVVSFVVTFVVFKFHKKQYKTQRLVKLYKEQYPTNEITHDALKLFERELKKQNKKQSEELSKKFNQIKADRKDKALNKKYKSS